MAKDKFGRKELLKYIEDGENLYVEFKEKFSESEKIAKEMIAFANTKGGIIIFGVRDNRKIIGVESEKEIAELIKETAEKYCEPPILYQLKYIEIKNKEIVSCIVQESSDKPHRIQDYQKELNVNKAQVYVRVNDKSIPASKQMIRILRAEAEQKPLYKYSISKLESLVFQYLDKNETITVKELCKAANISERRASRTLVKMVRADLIFIHIKDNGEEFFTHSGN